MKPIAVDLFACQGGATEGLQKAGFSVVAVEIDPRQAKHNPAEEVIVGDWKEELGRLMAIIGDEISFIWASPPCQQFTRAMGGHSRDPYADYIDECREVLNATGKPWVMENVVECPLIDPVILNGAMFSLEVTFTPVPSKNWDGPAPVPMTVYLDRPRKFETGGGFKLPAPPAEDPTLKLRGVGYSASGHGLTKGQRPKFQGATSINSIHPELFGTTHYMGREGFRESIPPAYAKWIGEQFLSSVLCEPIAA